MEFLKLWSRIMVHSILQRNLWSSHKVGDSRTSRAVPNTLKATVRQSVWFRQWNTCWPSLMSHRQPYLHTDLLHWRMVTALLRSWWAVSWELLFLWYQTSLYQSYQTLPNSELLKQKPSASKPLNTTNGIEPQTWASSNLGRRYTFPTTKKMRSWSIKLHNRIPILSRGTEEAFYDAIENIWLLTRIRSPPPTAPVPEPKAPPPTMEKTTRSGQKVVPPKRLGFESKWLWTELNWIELN